MKVKVILSYTHEVKTIEISEWLSLTCVQNENEGLPGSWLHI